MIEIRQKIQEVLRNRVRGATISVDTFEWQETTARCLYDEVFKSLESMIDKLAGTHYPGVCVVCFCYDYEGRFLFQLRAETARDEQGKWDVGGGRVHLRETLNQALIRELAEEYGVEPEWTDFLGFRQEIGDRHWIAFDYLCRVDPRLVRRTEDKNVADVKWVPRDKLPTPLHRALPAALAKYGPQIAELTRRR